jgi:amino acid transporter
MVRWSQLKRRLIGRPLASDELEAELLPKALALPVFASDPLSSVAYASEESMLVLAVAGAAAFDLLTPISLVIATVLTIVVISYRQTIRAYPGGGGAFIVARENLGLMPGMIAASSLLTDYVLTVAVSVVAGVTAITSASPSLLPYRVLISIGFVLLLTFINLRGSKESSLLFASPTYLFVTTVFTMLVFGFVECLDGECPRAVSAGAELAPEVGAVSLFLILRAFASGSTALTGVEAISNGVQAFREPKARNAGNTLLIMASMSITMYLGISTLARLFEVKISEATVDTYGTVISQIGRAAFNGGLGFYLLQIFTAGILILAANTAYQDFPRLSAILARHRLMPRQFRNRGDRLVFSNGIFALALLAILLIVIFEAQLTRLIQLYVVGVFIGFTLSQSGMVKHWLKTRERGWQRSVVINLVGAIATSVVLVVIAAVKFTRGAWIVIVFIPVLVVWMATIRQHYVRVAEQLRLRPPDSPYGTGNRVVVLASHIGRATQRAIDYAEMIQPEALMVVHVREGRDEDLLDTWDRLYPQHPLIVLEPDRGRTMRSLRAFVRDVCRAHPESFLTVVIPELIRRRRLWSLIWHPHGLVVKFMMLFEPGVVVTDLTYQRTRARTAANGSNPIEAQDAVVLISEVTGPTHQAVAYARCLAATSLRCVHLDVDEDQRDRVLRSWDPELGPLEVVESPYRGIVRPMLRYLRRLRRDANPGTLINVIIPEFIVPGLMAQFLHNQTGFAIKASLIFEPRIAVTSVPWHLSDGDEGLPHGAVTAYRRRVDNSLPRDGA